MRRWTIEPTVRMEKTERVYRGFCVTDEWENTQASSHRSIRVQQQMSACNDGWTLPRDGNRSDLVLAVHRRRLRYLWHVLRMPAERMVRRALMALVSDTIMYPTGSLFSDCQGVALPQLVAMASNRTMWRAKVASLSWTCVFVSWTCVFESWTCVFEWRFLVLLLYHRTLGV